jgi:hypothetical protein
MKALIALFLLIGASSLFAANDIDTNRYVSFQYNPDKYYDLTFQDVKPATLTQDEINTIFNISEKSIGEYMSQPEHIQKYKEQGVKEEVYTIPFSDYRFQLVPVINEQGEKVVWVNAICNYSVEDMAKSGTDWRADVISTSGGGPCYFNLYINLTTMKVDSLVVNEFLF